MARFTAVDPQTAGAKAQPLLAAVRSALGVTPNMMRTMAGRPAVLDGYLALTGALAKGRLGRRVGEQVALAVAEENGCHYCAAAHTLLGAGAGLSAADVEAARAAGLDDGDPGEVVAHVALNVFTNYSDGVAGTEIDFPAVRPPRAPRAAGAVATAVAGA